MDSQATVLALSAPHWPGALPASPSRRRMVSIVVPCYNECAVLDEFLARLRAVLQRLEGFDFEIVCVDDGSTDGTLALLQRHARCGDLRIVELSRNFGKEAALTAGLDEARGDAVVPIDADLQHPPECIAQMISHWEAGADVVLARRVAREPGGLFKRKAAGVFYALYNRLADLSIPSDVGDFRLMDRKVVQALQSLPERQRFMKGLFAWVGFRQVSIDFVVAPRAAGRSAYGWPRLWALALDGLQSFSSVPLTMWTAVGFGAACLAFVMGSWIVVKTLLFGAEVPGFASLFGAVLFMGGIQLMSIGILGRYIGRIYDEVKGRPIYIVRSRSGESPQG
ncbi:MAG: glycosyltransferase [Comamonadaceae bacterium]|nr:MAG: glycosyltransferase [Comamonadaceae bacterium]